MSQNKRFIDLYNQLDQLLRQKYHSKSLSESVISRYVVELTNSYFQEDQRRGEELETIRNLRNNLVHSLQIDNDDLFIIQQHVLDVLINEIDLLSHPILVKDKMIKINDVYVANLDTKVKVLIKAMLERGFSYIPIVNPNNQLIGVFSAITIFASSFMNKQIVINENIQVQEFQPYLSLAQQKGKYFMFVNEESEIEEVLNQYASNAVKGRKLALIFVTENGLTNEEILGILTPFDLLYRK